MGWYPSYLTRGYRKDTFRQPKNTVEIAVERAIQASKGLESAVQLVFGIDPGPRPGIAWLADGIVVGSAQLEQIEFVADHITGLTSAVKHQRMCVKVGDGAPLLRDRIINQLILRGIETLQVNEYKTSSRFPNENASPCCNTNRLNGR